MTKVIFIYKKDRIFSKKI